MRYLVVSAAVLSLVACGSSYHATRLDTAPFVKEGMQIAGGLPVVGDVGRRPGLTLDYRPGQQFAIGIAVDNKSHSDVVVTRVRALEPPGTLVRQVGTVLSLFDPPKCSGLCPAYSFPIRPTATATGRPVVLGPGKRLGVGLDFRLKPCSAALAPTRAGPSRVEVTFHRPGGGSRRQILELGWSRLLLRFGISKCNLRE